LCSDFEEHLKGIENLWFYEIQQISILIDKAMAFSS